MKTTAIVAALASASSAAVTVTVSTIKCGTNDERVDSFGVQADTLFKNNFQNICGLAVDKVDGAEAGDVMCQAFKDAEGTVPGSAQFNFKNAAHLSLTPVTEQSIMCKLSSSAGSSASLVTVTPAATASATPSSGTASGITVTLEKTKCGVQPVVGTGETFDVPAGSLVKQDINNVCGLMINKVTGGSSVQITCEAFKDAEGTQSGGNKFSQTRPATFSLNPISQKAIKCDVWDPSGSSASASATVDPTGGAYAPGVPVPTGVNGTIPTGTASGNTPEYTGAAGKNGLSAVGIAGAFAAALL